MVVDPTGQFAYVVGGCGDVVDYVSMYTIDATTGALVSVGPRIVIDDEGPDSVAVTPDGKFVYAASRGAGGPDILGGGGSISAYSVNATTGALTFTATELAACEPAPSPGSCSPWSVAVHPSGKFAYVVNEGGYPPTAVSMYNVAPTSGSLGLIGQVAVGGYALSVAMHPSGTFAYVVETNNSWSSSSVSTYFINTATGVLTSVGTVDTGSGFPSITIHPSGRFAYVVNPTGILTFGIDATTGTLTPIGTVASGLSSIAIHPSGKFAYAISGSNDVSTCTIDTSTGALTSIGTIPAGSSPASIVIHPSGKFAYVTDSGSHDIWTYAIDAATGTLTLIASIGS
jgi:6-phosphogluconolactonase (cycloisomerase 2 family)